MNHFKRLINWVDRKLVPEKFQGDPIMLRKARILVALHSFLFLIAAGFHISNTVFYPEAENPSLIPAMLILICLSIIFKVKGNFILSGNLLSLFFSLVLMAAVPSSGGIYSDNLLWMMAAPLLALLFANMLSGLCWLIFLLGYTCYLYWLEIHAEVSYREQILDLDAGYYLVTWSGLFIIVVGIVLIFAHGQQLIFNALKEKQEELRRQKEEIAQQARILRETQARLKASNRELEQFAYAASHDLKEPLRMIGAYVQLLQRKLSDKLDADTSQYMNFVTDGVSRMDRLLTDLLEYSRIGRKDSMVKKTNLNDTLLVVVNNLMNAMREHKASITANTLPTIDAPPSQMVQLFQNLLSNAIKFRKKDAAPHIDIVYEFANGKHHFYFKDNGIGIPADQTERIFQLFERLHRKEEYEGTGIGLATCQKIVKNLGGEIWVTSQEGVGSTFTFYIPQN